MASCRVLIDPFLWQSAAAPSHTSSFGHVGALLPLRLAPTSLPAFPGPISVLLIFQSGKVNCWIWCCLAFTILTYIYSSKPGSLFCFLSTSPLLVFSPHFSYCLSSLCFLLCSESVASMTRPCDEDSFLKHNETLALCLLLVSCDVSLNLL